MFQLEERSSKDPSKHMLYSLERNVDQIMTFHMALATVKSDTAQALGSSPGGSALPRCH